MEAAIIQWAVENIAGPAALPTIGCVLLWFQLRKSDDRRADEIKEYLSVIAENSRIIGENTSALNRLDRK